MRSNIKQTHYVLDFSDIEDISDNESESSSYQRNQPPNSPPRSDIKSLQQGSSLQPVKKEIVEIPSLLIQQEEDQIPRRKVDNLIQRWEVNFDELSECEEVESTPESIELQKDSTPPIEEPQYIEQYFEDQHIMERLEIDQEQLILESAKENQKQTLITKQEYQQQNTKEKLNNLIKINQSQKEYLKDVTQKRDRDVIIKSKQIVQSKFYNPKNSLIYLRLRGREDLYKRNDSVIDEAQKPQEVDQLLEGLDCINNLLIDLSNVKEKKHNIIDKSKQVQLEKNKVDEQSVNQTEKQSNREVKVKEQTWQKNQIEMQVQKQIESAQKQQLQQEAALAKQIRQEKQQQEKEIKKQQEQKQVYKILTKKLINQGMPLYRCVLRQKQRDFIKWLRVSEIALINEGEKEIYRFEKRLSDQMFLSIHKQNMKSITITKQFMFDPITLHYVQTQEQENVSNEKEIKQEIEKNNISINKNNSEHKQSKEKKQQKQKKLKTKDPQDCIEILEKQKEKEKQFIVQKEKGIQSNSDDEDFDLLDADKIKILKIVIDKRKYHSRQKQQSIQSLDEHKQSDNGVMVELAQDQLNYNNLKDILHTQIKQEKKQQLNMQNQDEIKSKKNKTYKYKEQPLSRLETNDDIKKIDKIYKKKQEKKKQDFLQILNEIEIEQKQQQLKELQKKKYQDIQQNKDKLKIQKYEQNKLHNNQRLLKEVDTKIENVQRIKKTIIMNQQDIQDDKSSSIDQGVIYSDRVQRKKQGRRLRKNDSDNDNSGEISYVERNRNNQKRLKK